MKRRLLILPLLLALGGGVGAWVIAQDDPPAKCSPGQVLVEGTCLHFDSGLPYQVGHPQSQMSSRSVPTVALLLRVHLPMRVVIRGGPPAAEVSPPASDTNFCVQTWGQLHP
jgi:hypothetical protein